MSLLSGIAMRLKIFGINRIYSAYFVLLSTENCKKKKWLALIAEITVTVVDRRLKQATSILYFANYFRIYN